MIFVKFALVCIALGFFARIGWAAANELLRLLGDIFVGFIVLLAHLIEGFRNG
ncbi:MULTISPECIES: hypothetical protein [unclassified Mameliella]|uniref:hypothetical protein n=1 Tax=Mameliella sp. LZ-28 TaxID=2484146 RepID=UPI00143FA061|nr:hypothetical protein [Mameliella sp. LZ-28]